MTVDLKSLFIIIIVTVIFSIGHILNPTTDLLTSEAV